MCPLAAFDLVFGGQALDVQAFGHLDLELAARRRAQVEQAITGRGQTQCGQLCDGPLPVLIGFFGCAEEGDVAATRDCRDRSLVGNLEVTNAGEVRDPGLPLQLRAVLTFRCVGAEAVV